MLEIKNLSVKVDKKEILKNINMSFDFGKTYFLLGRNGSGKSSLALTIMGHPNYVINSGDIFINKKNITKLSPEDRNKLGIFLSFQNIPELKGIKLIEFLRTIFNEHLKSKKRSTKILSLFLFKKFIIPILKDLNINENFLERDLNVGFSGGEKRKIELLQIKLLNPRYIILDEIDSGLDIDSFEEVAKNLSKLKTKDNILIFITHNFSLINYIGVDLVYIMNDGKIIDFGDKKLMEKIKKEGFCNYCTESKIFCKRKTGL
ncbi:Fe-S cluster assembly ATPase SufC [Candidatus Gracilibacteria bacterium]|nr:Fe-S cluster assembly ATPase SufC [Candidatus Gracilibacteria bacterium]